MKVSNFPLSPARHTAIDLHTVHETLSYMHDDMARIPALSGVAQALERTMSEISRAQRSARVRSLPSNDAKIPFTARFLPRRKR